MIKCELKPQAFCCLFALHPAVRAFIKPIQLLAEPGVHCNARAVLNGELLVHIFLFIVNHGHGRVPLRNVVVQVQCSSAVGFKTGQHEFK